jgi:hypothetical protein
MSFYQLKSNADSKRHYSHWKITGGLASESVPQPSTQQHSTSLFGQFCVSFVGKGGREKLREVTKHLTQCLTVTAIYSLR